MCVYSNKAGVFLNNPSMRLFQEFIIFVCIDDLLLSEMEIYESYIYVAGVALLLNIIGFAMAASVILCCARYVVKCCVCVFESCYMLGHYWYWMFILAGIWTGLKCSN